MAAIDLSDMFFAIPLDEASTQYTTFAWQGKQDQFKRLPQGYKNSPTIAHNILATYIDPKQYESKVIQYIDDILLYNNNLHILQKDLDKLIKTLRSQGWTINPNKIQDPGMSVIFLGIHWDSKGRTVPDRVINKLDSLKSPTSKKEAQQVMGLFMF